MPDNRRWMRSLTASLRATEAKSRFRQRWATFGKTVIVIDASVLAVALGDDGGDGHRARERLAHETLAAPELIDLEVASVWHRLVAAKLMAARRAGDAVADLADLPLRRSSHQPLLGRIWQLRHAVTAYDAAYIALAEALEVPVVTADARLAQAPGIKCDIEVIGGAAGG